MLKILKQLNLQPSSILLLILMKYRCGFFTRMHQICRVHCPPFSTCPFGKAWFLPCGNQLSHQSQSHLLLLILTRISVVSPLQLFSAKFWRYFLITGFISQLPTRLIHFSLAPYKAPVQVWLLSTSFISGTKHVMT